MQCVTGQVPALLRQQIVQLDSVAALPVLVIHGKLMLSSEAASHTMSPADHHTSFPAEYKCCSQNVTLLVAVGKMSSPQKNGCTSLRTHSSLSTEAPAGRPHQEAIGLVVLTRLSGMAWTRNRRQGGQVVRPRQPCYKYLVNCWVGMRNTSTEGEMQKRRCKNTRLQRTDTIW